MSKAEYDITVVANLSTWGPAAATVAEETRVQAKAGLSTALVHVAGDTAGHEGMHSSLLEVLRRGDAELLLPSQSVDTRLLVVRAPSCLNSTRPLPNIRAAHKIAVVTTLQPLIPEGSRRSINTVRAFLRERFGEGFVWAPGGFFARHALKQTDATLEVLPWDWAFTIDVEEWSRSRRHHPGRPPVIGRLGTPGERTWPQTRAELLDAYPDDPMFPVKTLGNPDGPVEILGHPPEHWTHTKPDADRRAFLSGIDFCVELGGPGSATPLDTTPVEALASGAVTVVPPTFRKYFGEACLYPEPGQKLRDRLARLHADSGAFMDLSLAGRRFVDAHFGAHRHLDRLARAMGGPKRTSYAMGPASSQSSSAAWRPSTKKAHKVLFVSSNGVGVGHLTRLLAMARRTSGSLEPVFMTMSQAVAAVRRFGFPCEFLASVEYTSIEARKWNRHLVNRLDTVLEDYDIEALVFDGVSPYSGIIQSSRRHPEIPFLWSRRGMWRKGRGSRRTLGREEAFTRVIEPGELAAALDDGLTATARSDRVVQVPPLILVDRNEGLDRDHARRELGIPTDTTTALVTLGAGNINDITSTISIVIRLLAKVPDLTVCVTDSLIAEKTSVDSSHGIHVIAKHPLAPYLPAFDFAVAAAGYNTFHELIAFGVPALFVPNLNTGLDDQLSRARFADTAGAGVCVTKGGESDFEMAFARLLDPEERERMALQCQELWKENGAPAAAKIIEGVL